MKRRLHTSHAGSHTGKEHTKQKSKSKQPACFYNHKTHLPIQYFGLLTPSPPQPTTHLIGTDAGGLQRLGAQLLNLIRDHVHAAREILNGGLLAAQVIDADLGVGHTATEAGLGVRFVLAVAVTVGGEVGGGGQRRGKYVGESYTRSF